MEAVISLSSAVEGEIKRFLQLYSKKNMDISDDVQCVMYVFKKSIEAVDMMSALVDNFERFAIEVTVELEREVALKVDPVNIDHVIRKMVLFSAI